jgi:ABC-type nitrate/sulfonate/bicarbonate transport system substrate-binding protein
MFKSTLCLSATLFFFSVTFLLCASAQEPIPIRIGQSSLTDVQVASIVTARSGFFKKYGLTPELIALQGGPQTIQALIANSIQFAEAFEPLPFDGLDGTYRFRQALVDEGFVETWTDVTPVHYTFKK